MFLLCLSALLLTSGGAFANLRFFQEGESATLECTGEGEVQYWFLHGKGNAINDNETEKDIYMNTTGTLEFKNVSKSEHAGKHICVTKVQENYLQAYTVEMDIRPLPPGDLWETQYKGMFVTGFISALVVLVLFVGFCLVHKYRWRDPLMKINEPHLVNQGAYVNPALIDDNEEMSIKM